MIENVFPPEMMFERERQLITALLDCAGVYYDVNFTRDQILGNPIQVVDGVKYPILELIGKQKNCTYTEIIEYWTPKMPENEREPYMRFSQIENVKARYAAGEKMLSHKFWTYDVLGNRMLAEQKILLYEDITTGDLLGLVYVANGSENEALKKKEEQLSEQYEEAARRADSLQNASINLPGGYHRCANAEGYPFLFISKSFEQLVGYTKEQLERELDNKFINLVYPEDLPRFTSFAYTIRESGNADTAYRIRRRDGELRWVQDSTLIVDWDGVRCFQCTLADITDFVRQQEDLAREKAEFEEFAETIPCGYHRCTTENGFCLEFVSDSFLETVGYQREEILGKPFIDLVAPEDQAFFMSHEPALAQNGAIDLVYRLRHKDGSYRWIKDYTVKVRHNGRESYQCILSDITTFVQQQEEMVQKNLMLTQQENLMRTMERSMPGGYHRCKAEKGFPFTYIGDHFTDIVGFTKEELQTQFENSYVNLLWDDDQALANTYEQMMEMRGKGNAYRTNIYRIRHKDGGYRWVTDATMFVDMGEDSFLQSIISDITEYIEGLNAAKKEAEASNLAKSTFLFNASHDIRTPMNAIKGFAHMIAQNPGDVNVVKETIEKIQSASDTLMVLMNDILDLARIERGKEEINAEAVSLNEHSESLYEMFSASMQEAGIDFRIESEIKHDHVLCDPLKLTRIGMNMLSNAKKFTPAGGTVAFGVHELDCDAKAATYRFYARDTGIGMSEDFRKRAFDQFERERTSTESGVAGSGLGLAIIKRMVELMGGTVDIQSVLGEGTEISATLTFPLMDEKDVKDKTVDLSSVDMTGKRVLLVEDNEFNREIARYMLEGLRLTVDEAENGLACVNKLLRSQSGDYDLILMDIQMPIMDGYTATKEIRSMTDKWFAGIPVIAMTANAFDEDKQKCLAIGMNGHIGKPIELLTLVQELSKFI